MENYTTTRIECCPNVHPQQNFFEFDQLSFDSRFDSGNLAKAEKKENFKVVVVFVIDNYNSITFELAQTALKLILNKLFITGFILKYNTK